MTPEEREEIQYMIVSKFKEKEFDAWAKEWERETKLMGYTAVAIISYGLGLITMILVGVLK